MLHISIADLLVCVSIGKSGSKLQLRSSVGIISSHATGARHALALLKIAMTEVRIL